MTFSENPRLRLLLIIAAVAVAGLLVFSILFFSNRKAPPATITSTAVSQVKTVTVTPIKVTSTAPLPASATPSQTSSVPTPQTYYVSIFGDDKNPGTAARPFKTLEKGTKVLRAGDTLYIKSGRYTLKDSLKITKSGTATNPITISTAPGEPSLAVISGDTNGDGKAEVPSTSIYNGLVELRGTYLRFMNFEVVYSKGRGIASMGDQNLIAKNNVHHTWESGVYVAAAYNTVDGNRIWRTADQNWCGGVTNRQCSDGWPGGLAWGLSHDSVAPGAAPHITIRNNIVYNTSGEGLLCMHTDYGLIENNVIYDNWAQNIDLDQCSNFTIQKNLIYYTADKTWWKGPNMPASGILLSNEGIKDSSGNTYPIGHDRIVINNILVGNGSNFHFWSGSGTPGYQLAGSALKNDLIAFNTMVTTDGRGVSISIDAGPHSNTRIISNIIYNTKSTLLKCGSTNGLTFSQNFWNRTPPAFAISAKDIIGDPLLVDPSHTRLAGAVVADWYKIKSGSPAVDRAESLSDVTVDYWNAQRSTTPDMGASEITP